ncbi:hypothetical protein GCM10011352_10430 [Marinobacterium zhoushanense]|uniref:Uncharacterized protein n=1 Tax=Marinobacterium zhoushanense TaxID=1679163 RepID=A0ABQ1K5W3_9GAMM|nr:hypothetical protein [Marinobacterium zhoushanense]GGB86443.1 hypothetical protein GCM10011352_10430 [Marinobacterium zhoushanense]
MTSKSQSFRSAFTTNRAEELGFDVWDDFVIPLFFDELDLKEAKKARRIVGGRGCGKTMLLRYFSHHSQFSKSREDINEDSLLNIGLYWRADTNFLPMLNKQKVDEVDWVLVFKHYLTLSISLEILKSLNSIATSRLNCFSIEDLERLNFDHLTDYDASFKGSYSNIVRVIKKKIRECENAIYNPPTLKDLIKIPDSFVTDGLIDEIKAQIPSLSNTIFSFYIDEYENLLEYQQKTINTKIKHGRAPLIFHIAMKVNGMKINETLGNESIQGIADYRNIDLDEFLSEKSDFDLFAAEILLHRISKNSKHIAFDKEIIKREGSINIRKTNEYKTKIIDSAKRILPGYSYKEMADQAIKNDRIRSRLLKEIEKHLKNKKPELDFVFDDNFPQEIIVLPALLSRNTIDANHVIDEFNKLRDGKKSKFSGDGSWVSNNFVGCYLNLFRAYDRPCPLYAGFNSFVRLAKGNIRHFLELCNAAVHRFSNDSESYSIPIEVQSLATRSASEDILNEAPTYGVMGNRIQKFIYNIGHIFEYSQMRKTQSEPEVNHFSIRGGYSGLSEDDQNFILEAEKWGVVYKVKSTKEKDRSNPDSVEWVLNPIYAPFFFISFRKKRKLDISPEQFRVLHCGSDEEIKGLERSFRSKWDLDDNNVPHNYTLI